MKPTHTSQSQPAIFCPVNTTLDIIGGKWKALIIYHLINGTQRFNSLQRSMTGITQRMLTLQLRELEADGLIHRTAYHVVPPKVEYSRTSSGRTLLAVIDAMHAWGTAYREECERIQSTKTKE